MIQFATENNRIRLRINVEAARAAGLTISSKLLRPAEIVGSRRTQGGEHRTGHLHTPIRRTLMRMIFLAGGVVLLVTTIGVLRL